VPTETLDLVGEFKDGISGPAKKAAKELTGIAKAVKEIKESFEVLESIGIGWVLEKLAEGVKELGEVFTETSKKIWEAEYEALKFGEAMKTSFELAGMSAADAADHFSHLIKLADELPFSVQDVFKYAQTFRDAGIGQSDATLKRLLQAAGGVQAASPQK